MLIMARVTSGVRAACCAAEKVGFKPNHGQRVLAQTGKGGLAGTEIVQHQPHAHRLQCLQALMRARGNALGTGASHIDHEQTRIDPGMRQRFSNDTREVPALRNARWKTDAQI